MANKKLTQDEYDEIAREVVERGESPDSPTLMSRLISEKYNKNPSFSTLQKMRIIWQSINEVETEKLPETVELPDALLKMTTDVAKGFLQKSRIIARDEVEAERAIFKEGEAKVNLKIEEISVFSDNQTQAIDVLREQLSELVKSEKMAKFTLENELKVKGELTLKLRDLGLDHAAQQQKINILDGRIDELIKKNAEQGVVYAHQKQVLEIDLKEASGVNLNLEKQISSQDASIQSFINEIEKLEIKITEAIIREKKEIENSGSLRGKLELVLEKLNIFEEKEILPSPAPVLIEKKKDDFAEIFARTKKSTRGNGNTNGFVNHGFMSKDDSEQSICGIKPKIINAFGKETAPWAAINSEKITCKRCLTKLEENLTE